MRREMASIVAIGHVGIAARNLDRLAAFYRDVMGLRQIFDIPAVKIFRVGDVDLFISKGEPGDLGFDLATNNIDAMRDRLSAGGVSCDPIRDDPPSHRSFMCVDPEGNRVTVVSAHADQPTRQKSP